jgi:transcriptional regulator with GAF, ATPase, and Fis domain
MMPLPTHVTHPATDRLAILDKELRLIYVDPRTWAEARGQGPLFKMRCYEALAGRAEPCRGCPALALLQGHEHRSASPVGEAKDLTCGLLQVFPLRSQAGDETLIVAHFHLKPCLGPVRTEGLGRLIGRSPAMQDLFEMIRLIAGSQATVLIQGESGTGKELVAKTIHELSPRVKQPFVVVDCAALPENLLESELFGHVKGAFTGAVSTKKGLFEEAAGGTIFLDEIADTSPQFQAKLLRILQEGELKPVGSNRRIKVDVRVISASNKDLAALVEANAFRRDLYYRLAVLPIIVPPLRSRREDIPLLARHFAEAAAVRHHKPAPDFAPAVMRTLTEASWPGNVRQLKHMIERAVITAPGRHLMLSDCFGDRTPNPAQSSDLRTAARDAAQAVERTNIADALHRAGGNKAKTARALQISRASLYNKLRTYGIE